MDQDGYFWFQARADDMIISAGYNIAGPEVEGALLGPSRGRRMRGRRRAGPGARPDRQAPSSCPSPASTADQALVEVLQDHVKRTIAPYKYPRQIAFRERLPKTATGKLQRFKLRRQAAAAGPA